MNYEICSEIKLQLWVKLHLLCVKNMYYTFIDKEQTLYQNVSHRA